MCTAVIAPGNELLCGNYFLSLGDILLTYVSDPIIYEGMVSFLLIKLLKETGFSILFVVVVKLSQVERVMVVSVSDFVLGMFNSRSVQSGI